MLPLTILALAAATPSVEAEALGLRLARNGMLATVAPLLTAKDTEDVIAGHPELSDADRAAFRATAARQSEASIARLDAAFGHAYAERLSVAELTELVAAAERPAARRFRSVMPETMAAAMGAIGKLDFKQDTIAAFCKDTGKLCPRK